MHSERDIRPAYDELWSSTWGSIQQVGPVHRHVHEHLARLVSSLPVTSVLDVGCGSGDALALLEQAGRYQLSGIDVSARALEIARTRVPSARVDLMDVQRERLGETFDFVFSIGVVEHLLDDVTAFRHMAEMTKSFLFVSTIAGRMRPSETEIGHVRNYSRLELRRKLELAGFDVVWVKGWGFPFYSPFYRTLAEWLPGGPPGGDIGSAERAVASMLYQLYRLNVPGRGDVLWALARQPS